MHDLRHQCIAVTGASRGIGAAIATELARQGFQVACLSRSCELPRIEGADEVHQRMFAVGCDITNLSSIQAAFEHIADTTPAPLVGLVNNAGMHLQGRSTTFSITDYEKVMSANATSVFAVSQVAHPHLTKSGGALIVNIGSFYEKLGVKGNLAYCASKAAVGAMTRCLAVEWARDGIRVMNVAPGYIETDLNRDEMNSSSLRAFLEKRIPAGGPGAVEDVASLVSLLFQLPGRFMTGETLYVDGGQGMAL